MSRFNERLRHSIVDILAVGLFIGSIFEVAFTSVHFNHAIVPFLVVAPLPLLLRRRFQLAAPAVAFAGIAIAATIDPSGAQPLTMPFFIGLLATGTFGAAKERRDAFVGLAIALGTLNYIFYEFSSGAGEYLWVTGFFSAAWAVGFFLNTRTQQATAMRERAERAEHERELRAQAAVAEERARIARELHDIIGHSVSVMTIQAGAVRRLLREDQEREREALRTVEETGRAALTEMRRLVGVLRRHDDAPSLVPQPSLEYVERLVEQAREAGLPTELRLEGEPTQLPQGVDLTAYRLVQEALTNALKHANATRAEVIVRYDNGVVELVVSDDGSGDGTGGGSGHGLVGMRERVAVVGGELQAGPRPEGGYELRAKLPVSA